jgi:biopolymer transport protein ExbB/TolQ
MKPTTIEQAVERLVKARQAYAQAERELQAAQDRVQRVREESLAQGIDPEKLNETIQKLEQEIIVRLNELPQ